MTWTKPREYKPGELYCTTTGRTVEILAADQVESESEGDYECNRLQVIAYKFVGGSIVHLRAARAADRWVKVEVE